MNKQKWTNIKAKEAEIITMRQSGKTRQEIAEHFGLKKEQIKNWVNRYNRAQSRLAAGIIPRPKGRPRKRAQSPDLVTEQAFEIERLKMENKLLRDFLRSTGRK